MKKDKKIISEDIRDLKYLVGKYTKEKNYAKATECQKEIQRLKNSLKILDNSESKGE